MATVTLKGNSISIKGDILVKGTSAPDFTFVKKDLSEGTLYAIDAKVKVIVAVPSLDTGVCALETKTFNAKLGEKAGVECVIVSKDLPFAMKRFCETEGVENVESGSDFRGDFVEQYNTLMTSGPLQGLSARAVFVVDGENNITYSELVPEITQEPNYDAVLKAVDELL